MGLPIQSLYAALKMLMNVHRVLMWNGSVRQMWCHANPGLTLKGEIHFIVERFVWSFCMRGGQCSSWPFPQTAVKCRQNVMFDSSTDALWWLQQRMCIFLSQMLTSLHVFKAKYWNIFHPRGKLFAGVRPHIFTRVGMGASFDSLALCTY